MSYIAGVDIGNSTTEVCVGEVTDRGNVTFLTSASCPTTGTKGTIENVYSVKNALKLAMSRIGRETSDIDLVRLNEAAPVIGDTAMETLTETVITDSSMIGHNPSTPAGAGQAVGEILLIENISGLFRALPIFWPHLQSTAMRKSPLSSISTRRSTSSVSSFRRMKQFL